MSTIGEKILILRTNLELTQAMLAERLCVVPATISSWERGVTEPSRDTIKKLASISYVPFEKLIDDDCDVPEYFEIDSYVPYSIHHRSDDEYEEVHTIYDADLADEGYLHRYVDAAGNKCSAIYRAKKEVWWHYRDHEPEMIYKWNKEHSK